MVLNKIAGVILPKNNLILFKDFFQPGQCVASEGVVPTHWEEDEGSSSELPALSRKNTSPDSTGTLKFLGSSEELISQNLVKTQWTALHVCNGDIFFLLIHEVVT